MNLRAPNRISTELLERELNRALALGAVTAWSRLTGQGERPRRRWVLSLPDGESVIWEAGRVQAFVLGVALGAAA